MASTHRIAGGLVLGALLACAPGDDSPGDVGGPDDGRDDAGDVSDVPDVPETVTCAPGRIYCVGSSAHTCNAAGDGWVSVAACAEPTPACVPERGCAACRPGEGVCEGTTARMCLADGSGWATDECSAAAGERCASGLCTDLSEACEAARAASSYEACDYWPAQLANSDLLHPDDFHYALVVGNRRDVAANVEVTNGTGVVATAVVPSNGTQSIEFEWNESLRSPAGTSIVRDGAYRLKSDVPVTVYQFNPLRYWTGPLWGSYSNDASLLLPRHVLTGNYVVASRSTFMTKVWTTDNPEVFGYLGNPGLVAVVGIEDGTDVEVVMGGNTMAGPDGSGIPAYSGDAVATFRLDRFDMLQILSAVPSECTPVRSEPHPSNPYQTVGYCDLGSRNDLTGTTVTASRPVAVYGGHDCTFVPYDRWACDHLEEQMFPLEAWGDDYLATRSDPIVDEPNVWRILSGVDGNAISFEPASAHAPLTLDRAEWTEFSSRDDFRVTGTGPALVVQYLIGEGSDLDSIGDPAMALAVPVEQFRTAYNFLAPEDYRNDPAIALRGENWINVIAPTGADVTLDGSPVLGFSAIGATGYGVSRVLIPGGSHAIASAGEFGILCYGYGNYTSYMYPGGLDVDPINPFI